MVSEGTPVSYLLEKMDVTLVVSTEAITELFPGFEKRSLEAMRRLYGGYEKDLKNVDLPMHIVRTSLGIRKYSTLLAKAKEFGGMMHSSVFIKTKELSLKFLGSTKQLCTLVKTINSLDTLRSYP